jgi:predicted Zn-dependent peptidase
MDTNGPASGHCKAGHSSLNTIGGWDRSPAETQVPDEFIQCTPEELQVFYDRYYVPSNMSLVCIGSLPRISVLRMVQETPFAMQKSGQRMGIPAAFSLGPLQKQEQIIHLSAFSPLASETAACTFEWVIPLHFTTPCMRILCDMLEELLMEELRYKQHLTYDVSVRDEYYQDCHTLRIHFEIPPAALERAKDTLWYVLRSIHRSQELFLEAKRERIHCMYRMDYSGYDLLEAALGDLEDYHRLISFTEELHLLEQTQFSNVIDLADFLTPQRLFCFVLLP